MSWLDGLRHRLRTVLCPGVHEAELREEMRLHQELDAQQQGDVRAARRRFGNETWYREEVRRMTWLAYVDAVRQDVGYAWRNVRRSPGLTVLIVLTLALGIGVNTTIFSFLDRLYLRPPLGLEDPGTLRRIYTEYFNTGDGVPFASQVVTYPHHRLLRDAFGDAARVGVYSNHVTERLGRAAGAPRVAVAYGSAQLWDVLGTRIALGRFYTAGEDVLGEGAPVAVISDRFWRRHFDADPAVLGRELELNGRTLTVIGVTERGFTGLESTPVDVWAPLGAWPSPGGGPWWESTNTGFLRTVMRIRDEAELHAYLQRATMRTREYNQKAYPQPGEDRTNILAGSIIEARGPAKPRQEYVISTRLIGVSAVVLLIAWANVVNLLLRRALQRQREHAVRLALGIPRVRLMRLVAMETLMLATLAGMGALLATSWSGAVLRSLLMPDVDWASGVVDGRVVVFTMLLALSAGACAALIPAWQSTRTNLTGALKASARAGARTRSLLRSSLVAAQAALSVLLLVGAALFVRSLANVYALDIGYDTRQLLFADVEFAVGERPSWDALAATVRGVADELDGRTGVQSVALSTMRPMGGISFHGLFTETDSLLSWRHNLPTTMGVTASFFVTTGLPVVSGRSFEPGAGYEVVVNEAMATLAWPGADPLGRCIYVEARANPCHRVVGVVKTARRDRIIEDSDAALVYLPVDGPVIGGGADAVIVRAEPGAERYAARQLEAALQAAFPRALVTTLTMHDYLDAQYRPWQLGATLFTALGVLALLIALLGIYSTIAYSVAQRTHEFGVRMALGARVRDVLGQVVAEGLSVVAAGVLLGIILTVAAGRMIQSLLYGVRADDVTAMLGVSAALLVTAALAALVPAFRAAGVDPARTLRDD